MIIFTHMPIKDWNDKEEYIKGFVYVSGHNHYNYYFDDYVKRIYSDNQIGYKQKNVYLKHFSIDYNYDWFSYLEDGIHEISRKDYENFYRGINENVNFNRDFEKLFMLKRENTYMFIMKTKKSRLLILNGGALKKAENDSLEYYYKNMVNYSKSIKMFLSKYGEFQKKVSQ